jgi:hypothetical protein
VVEGQARRDTGWFRTGCGLAALASLLLAGLAAADEACAPWPGEPRPLPGLADPDPLRAQWAALRVRELSAAARALEADDPVRARALWRHARCIAPEDPEAIQKSEQPLNSVIVHRPEVERGEPDLERVDAWASLAAPVIITPPVRDSRPAARPAQRPAPPQRPVSTAQTQYADLLLEETAGHVRAAWFDAALVSAERTRKEVAKLPPEARRTRTARLEVQAATAALALGREAEARESLSRALAADPRLTLDPGTTSPKVRRALDEVRAAQAAR